MSCHRVGEAGAKLGPDRSSLRKIRNLRDLLKGIACPDARIAREDDSFRLENKLGETRRGKITREPADPFIIGTMDGREVLVPRAANAKPEAVANSLTQPALDPIAPADLITFLKTLPQICQ